MLRWVFCNNAYVDRILLCPRTASIKLTQGSTCMGHDKYIMRTEDYLLTKMPSDGIINKNVKYLQLQERSVII